ncbi:DNA mismatch repair protein mutS [Desulfococcus multivorans DSM 2059]|uniref:DNA mismatch repair protein MutS n=2 Tax=Desulfococcaceae TaxID=2931039 RepID=S7TPM8_DESML|nr:DNA mismatch repair protein mutS [Desulfococcus multivorans DSM 2059]SJZ53173.1 DNA mismatch repair protein MutS [Desulfococcus multivorans DSM 2059]
MAIKAEYPDALLFYRMGDFYELFFEDAEKASKILEITLTSRNKNQASPVPMCGVPCRAVQGYIARIIERGLKVAVCDQVEDPAQAKGLVKREVVRVITPGMIIENEFLDAKTHNYLLAVAREGAAVGLAYVDISTGTFRVTQSDGGDGVSDEISRVSPSEVLLGESLRDEASLDALMPLECRKSITFIPDRYFNPAFGKNLLIDQFGTLTLEGFGCEHLPAAVGAAGAVLHYVSQTQKQKIDHIRGIETYFLNDFMAIDDQSRRNLELLENLKTGKRRGTLIDILDHTVTAMGGRLLANWLRYPLLKPEEITSRLDAVEEACANRLTSEKIREHLSSVYDLERLGSRISMGHANARDLVTLKRSLLKLPEIQKYTSEMKASLFRWVGSLSPLMDVADLIDRAIREDAPSAVNEGGIIKSGFDSVLDELIKTSKDGKGWLVRLEAEEKKKTGITALKVRYNKVFGYYLEVPKIHAEKIPDHYIRKQTLVNAERYVTEELKTFESTVLNAEEKRARLEYEIFNDVRTAVRDQHRHIQDAADFTARLDVLLNLAHVAAKNDYHRPHVNLDGILTIEDGRHPVVEKMITDERFVPNSIRMDSRENQVLIITGPNMAGKSTVLRQAALTTILAQVGAFVPAARAEVPVTDKIFTRVGALDNLSQGESTFMVEMQETANILNNATPQSLVILDEIGRGTSTFDGLSIAWAVAEYLHDLKGKGVKTLFATHYHELTALEQSRPRVKNFNIAVKEVDDRIIFLRKLVPGGTNRSYGIQVARLAGIPESIIHRAKTVLSRIENEGHIIRREEGASPAEEASHPVQLGLFRPQETLLVETLQSLDVSRMTPLEALLTLNELQEKIRFH